jgi:hypothetical protein
VPGNRGTRVEASVDVDCPAETLFRFWRNLEQLPRVMRNVESVQQGAGKQSHWKVAGPLGQSLEWDAEIVNEHENRLIAWQSLPGATVSNAGSVPQERLSPNCWAVHRRPICRMIWDGSKSSPKRNSMAPPQRSEQRHCTVRFLFQRNTPSSLGSRRVHVGC